MANQQKGGPAIHIYVKDSLKSFQRALEAGGISVQEPVHKEADPDQRDGVKDPAGNTWGISTQLIYE